MASEIPPGDGAEFHAALCATFRTVELAILSLAEAVKKAGPSGEMLPDRDPDRSIFQEPEPVVLRLESGETMPDHGDFGWSRLATRLDLDLREAIQQTLKSRDLLNALPVDLKPLLRTGQAWVISLREDVLDRILNTAHTHFPSGLKSDPVPEHGREVALRVLLSTNGADSLIAAWKPLLQPLHERLTPLYGAIEELRNVRAQQQNPVTIEKVEARKRLGKLTPDGTVKPMPDSTFRYQIQNRKIPVISQAQHTITVPQSWLNEHPPLTGD
jgi:hypothetical protein